MVRKLRKYRFADRASAEAEVARLERQQTVNMIVLNDVTSGNVQWHRRGAYRLGVIRPDSPSGGYVALEWAPIGQSPSTTAYYLDDFRSWVRTLDRPMGNDPHAREIDALRELAVIAGDAQRAAYVQTVEVA
jgi:hypothetical protein